MIINRYYIIDANGKHIKGPFDRYSIAKGKADLMNHLEIDGRVYGIEVVEVRIKIEDYLQGEGNG